MATSVPRSLQINPDYISNWMNPRGDVPTNMPWVEWMGDGGPSPGFFQGSVNQPCSGHMVFATPWSNFITYHEDIMLSILGGYSPDLDAMLAPMQWPYENQSNNALFATDAKVSWTFMDNSVPWVAGKPAPHRVALYEVVFQSLPYNVNEASGTLGFNINWWEIRGKASNEAYQAPPGNYTYSSGPAGVIGNPALYGSIFNSGVSYAEMVIHRIPESYATAFTSGVVGIPSDSEFVAQINSDDFLGAAIGTLMLDSIVQAPYGDWLGQNIYDIHLFFKYRQADNKGWNSALDIAGNWQSITQAVGAGPAFMPTSFTTMLSDLIPVQG